MGSSFGAGVAAASAGSGRSARPRELMALENQDSLRVGIVFVIKGSRPLTRTEIRKPQIAAGDQIEAERIVGLIAKKANQIFAVTAMKTSGLLAFSAVPAVCGHNYFISFDRYDASCRQWNLCSPYSLLAMEKAELQE